MPSSTPAPRAPSSFAETPTRDGVVIEVSDDGHWKPPADPPSEERGRGLTLIRSLVSDAQIKTGDRGTTVRIHQHA